MQGPEGREEGVGWGVQRDKDPGGAGERKEGLREGGGGGAGPGQQATELQTAVSDLNQSSCRLLAAAAALRLRRTCGLGSAPSNWQRRRRRGDWWGHEPVGRSCDLHWRVGCSTSDPLRTHAASRAAWGRATGRLHPEPTSQLCCPASAGLLPPPARQLFPEPRA